MHWGDDGSMEILEALLKESSPVDDTKIPNRFHLYISSRLQGRERLEEIAAKEQVKIFSLQPFDRDGVSSYFTSVFGIKTLSDSLKTTIPAINERVGGESLIPSGVDQAHDYESNPHARK